MPITDSQLKGNWGEQFIASELTSQGCFIRQVTQGHDTGIDLYCETTQDNEPFLHFWCQVKTSKDYKGKRKELTYKPGKKYIDYWLKQPVPVFIFLVPDIRNSSSTPPYYIFNIVDHKDYKLCSLKKITEKKDLKSFLDDELRVETYKWDLSKGKVSPLKTTKQQYVKYIPKGYTHKYDEKVLSYSISRSLWILARDNLFRGYKDENSFFKDLHKNFINDINDRLNQIKPYVLALEKFIGEIGYNNYENFEIIGHYYYCTGNMKKASSNYNSSKDSIKRDTDINIKEDFWSNKIVFLEKMINRINEEPKIYEPDNCPINKLSEVNIDDNQPSFDFNNDVGVTGTSGVFNSE